MDFNVDDRIQVSYKGSEEVLKAIQAHQDYISQETLTLEMNVMADSSDENHVFKIDQYELELLIKVKN